MRLAQFGKCIFFSTQDLKNASTSLDRMLWVKTLVVFLAWELYLVVSVIIMENLKPEHLVMIPGFILVLFEFVLYDLFLQPCMIYFVVKFAPESAMNLSDAVSKNARLALEEEK